MEHEHLQDAAILIMANKQDLKDAMNVKEMTDVLSLHSLKRHNWHIQVSGLSVPIVCSCALPSGFTASTGLLLNSGDLNRASTSGKVSFRLRTCAHGACKCRLFVSFHVVDVCMQATCAKTGEGLMEGMEWIAQRMKGEAAQVARSPQLSPAKAVAA